TARFKGYFRDETYPLSIRFLMDGGHTTALFPFVARPPFPDEVELMDEGDKNKQSIEEYTSTCDSTERKYKWQFLNTARDVEDMECETSTSNNSYTHTETQEFTCLTTKEIRTGEGVLSMDIPT